MRGTGVWTIKRERARKVFGRMGVNGYEARTDTDTGYDTDMSKPII
jgi:hypothetical protein